MCNANTMYTLLFKADWPIPTPAIGRIANYSSLRKNRPKEYSIYDAYFGEHFEFLSSLFS